MYKVTLLLKGQTGASSSMLTERWMATPWPSLGVEGACERHLHHRTVRGDMPIENAPAGEFDAVDEFWFAHERAARACFMAASFRDFWQRHCAPLLREAPLSLSGAPRLLWCRETSPAGRDPVKIITLPVRRDGMSREAFAHHWIDVHSGLALAGPGTRGRLLRLEPCPADRRAVTPFPDAPFDGVGTIEFTDAEALRAEFGSAYYRDVMAPDEPRFTNPGTSCALRVESFDVGPMSWCGQAVADLGGVAGRP